MSAPTLIQEEKFELEGKKLIDSLFFFQLIGEHMESYEGQKIGEWYGKEAIIHPTRITD